MNTDTEIQAIDGAVVPSTGKGAKRPYLFDTLIVVVMGILMFCGASWQLFGHYTDAAKYQCYAGAFLHGVQEVQSYPANQCGFLLPPKPAKNSAPPLSNATIAASLHRHGAPNFLVNFVKGQNVSQPLHALPHEYPLLTLIPFLLVMISPQHWYQVAFALFMIVLAAGMYFMLARFKSRKAAVIGAVLLVIGCWGTVAGRFDLVPSLLTLLAILLAERQRWTWAYVVLAVAFLIKFYPLVLLIPFFLEQQMNMDGRWNAWRRWKPLAAFIVVCVLTMGVSFLLSVEGTIGPLSYFQTRPIQVESFGSSIIWLSTFVRHHPMQFVFTYGSLNVLHVYSTLVSRVESVLLIAGLAVVCWLQWKRKMDLATASIMTLLVVMVTGKVFSPQYLIWIVPLIAYAWGTNLRWMIMWVAICGLTTFIYPYIYNMADLIHVPYVPWFYPTVTVRNFILLAFILMAFYSYSRSQPSLIATKSSPKDVHSADEADQSHVVDITDEPDKAEPSVVAEVAEEKPTLAGAENEKI